jgi:hypothetical protein
MASKPGFFDYIVAAFNARPMGMFVAPNWVGIAAFGLLGLTNPGFWVLGAGLELGYLLTLATNGRFQRTVASKPIADSHREWIEKTQRALARLGPGERHVYESLAQRCRSIIEMQMHGASEVPHGLEAQADSLGRLAWTFLRLLVARKTIADVVKEGADPDTLQARIDQLTAQRDDPAATEELRRSISGQIDILTQRVQQRRDAERKLAFIDAEIDRIEQQVELIREQAALSTDPELLSRRIDEIASTLGTTGQWIRDQQQVYGAMEDLLTEPPPLAYDMRVKEKQ